MDENDGWMWSRRRGTDQPTGKLHAAVGETHLLVPLDAHASREAGCGAGARPGQRGNLPAPIALKLDSRFDDVRHRDTGPREEPIRRGCIERADITILIEGDELVASGQLRPQLEVDEGVLLPLVHTRIATQRGLVHRAN